MIFNANIFENFKVSDGEHQKNNGSHRIRRAFKAITVFGEIDGAFVSKNHQLKYHHHGTSSGTKEQHSTNQIQRKQFIRYVSS